MIAGNVHAFAMIGVVVLAVTGLVLGKRQRSEDRQFVIAKWLYTVIMIVFAANVMIPCLCYCARPVLQVAIGAACGIIVLQFGRNQKRAVTTAVIITIATIGLSIHYTLLFYSSDYCGERGTLQRDRHAKRTLLVALEDFAEDSNLRATEMPIGWIADWPCLENVPPESRESLSSMPRGLPVRCWHSFFTAVYKTKHIREYAWWLGGPVDEDVGSQIEFRPRPNVR